MSTDGENWIEVDTGNTLEVVADENSLETSYHAVVVGLDGIDVVSDPVCVILKAHIVTQPSCPLSSIGDTTEFSLVATGVLSRLWQTSNDGGELQAEKLSAYVLMEEENTKRNK